MTDLVPRLGWIWLVAAPATAVVALTFAAWRAARRSARADVEHRAAVVALAACALVLAITPLVLERDPGIPAPPQGVAPAVAQDPPATPPSSITPFAAATRTLNLDAIAAVTGAAWLAAFCWMTVRLTGGWWAVRRLVARAELCRAPGILAVVERVAIELDLGTSPRVAVSAEIDAPMIAGVRPTLLLPTTFVAHQEHDVVASLVAHELAHVRRRDYLANLLQSTADTVLAALPPARWLSQRVRETREFCCDDIAARVEGDSAAYVRALTTIARGSLRLPATVLGAGGPRLQRRVEILLNGPSVPRYRGLLAAAAVAGAILSGLAALRTLDAAATQPTQAPETRATTGHGFTVTIAWAPEQPGSAITMRRMLVGANFACESAQIQNDANVTVTGVAFSAVVNLRDARAEDSPRVYSGDLVSVRIPPSGTADVEARVLPQQSYLDFARDGSSFHVTCVLTKVTYENGAVWELPRRLVAVTTESRFGLYAVEVPRAIMGSPTPGFLCLNDRRGEFSRGAIIPIRNEPGSLAECVEALLPDGGTASQWIEYRRGDR